MDNHTAARHDPQVGPLLVLRFLCEVALLVVLAVIGAQLADALPVRIVFAVLLPLVVAVFWGAYLAPRSPRRLPDGPRLVVEVVLFGGSAAVLAAVGFPVWAAVYGVVGVGLAVLVRVPAISR